MDRQNWKKKALKLMHRENKDLLPNFRDARKTSITDLKKEFEHTMGIGASFTKEVVDQLLKDNLSRMYQVTDKFDSIDHLSHEEKIKSVEKKLKNEYIEKLKETFTRRLSKGSHQFKPLLDASFVMGKYKGKTSKKDLNSSYVQKIEDQGKLDTLNTQQTLKLDKISLNESSRIDVLQNRKESYIQLDYQQMKDKLRQLMFDDDKPETGWQQQSTHNNQELKEDYEYLLESYQTILEDEKSQQSETSKSSEKFGDHVDKLLLKMQVGDQTIIDNALEQNDGEEENDKYQTSQITNNSAVKGKYSQILDSMTNREIHENYLNQLMHMKTSRRQRQQSRSVLPSIITPKTVKDQDQLISKISLEMGTMKHSQRKLYNILKSRKDLVEDRNQYLEDYNNNLQTVHKKQFQVKLPKIKNKNDPDGEQNEEDKIQAEFVDNLINDMMNNTDKGQQINENTPRSKETNEDLEIINENSVMDEAGETNTTMMNKSKRSVQQKEFSLTLDLKEIITQKQVTHQATKMTQRASPIRGRPSQEAVAVTSQEAGCQAFSRSESMNRGGNLSPNQKPVNKRNFQNFKAIGLSDIIDQGYQFPNQIPQKQRNAHPKSFTQIKYKINLKKAIEVKKPPTTVVMLGSQPPPLIDPIKSKKKKRQYYDPNSSFTLKEELQRQIHQQTSMQKLLDYELSNSASKSSIRRETLEVSQVVLEPYENLLHSREKKSAEASHLPEKKVVIPSSKSRQHKHSLSLNSKYKKPQVRQKPNGILDDLLNITMQTPQTNQQICINIQEAKSIKNKDLGKVLSQHRTSIQPQPQQKVTKVDGFSQVYDSSGQVSMLKEFTPNYFTSARDSNVTFNELPPTQ